MDGDSFVILLILSMIVIDGSSEDGDVLICQADHGDAAVDAIASNGGRGEDAGVAAAAASASSTYDAHPFRIGGEVKSGHLDDGAATATTTGVTTTMGVTMAMTKMVPDVPSKDDNDVNDQSQVRQHSIQQQQREQTQPPPLPPPPGYPHVHFAVPPSGRTTKSNVTRVPRQKQQLQGQQLHHPPHYPTQCGYHGKCWDTSIFKKKVDSQKWGYWSVEAGRGGALASH